MPMVSQPALMEGTNTVSIMEFTEPTADLRATLFVACEDFAIRAYENPAQLEPRTPNSNDKRQRRVSNASTETLVSGNLRQFSATPTTNFTGEIDPTRVLYTEFPCSARVIFENLSSTSTRGGLFLAAGCSDEVIRIWSASGRGVLVRRLVGWHTGPVNVRFISDPPRLVSTSRQQQASWVFSEILADGQAEPDQTNVVGDGSTAARWRAAMLPDHMPGGYRFSEDGGAEIKDMITEETLLRVPCRDQKHAVRALIISPVNDYAATIHADGGVEIRKFNNVFVARAQGQEQHTALSRSNVLESIGESQFNDDGSDGDLYY
ncbi:hypothetical protein BOTBODRAFT_66490 [Botryobasidium botryosum FD-172 SS1]|uniref:Uncharacterized protein n=1 Tax=Botryobasidium botryosum (strain FD-172 SS1) TaxID=930990 RepID=A0A067MET3_BOTB1|nr:hypothetical protein BOTBODRAFT_66490 [Botryobasidium botryosum FD-172 SS1]